MITAEPQTINEHFHLLIAGSVLALFSLWIAWRSGFFTTDFKLQVQSLNIGLVHVLGAFFSFIIVSILVAPLIIVLFFGIDIEPSTLSVQTQGWVNAITILLSSLAVIGYVKILPIKVQQTIWRSQNNTKKTFQNLLFGACTWFVGYPVMIVVGQLAAVLSLLFFEYSPVDQVAVKFLKETMSYPILFIFSMLLIVTLVPIIEEMMFRGFLQTWLRKWIGPKKAIVIASMVFAIFHFSLSQGINNIELIFSLFTLSLFLGFIYERQQSLWANIGLHATFNAISVLFLTIQ